MYGLLMDTTLNPKQTDPPNALVARADEELAHAYEQITSADEQIARAEEQLSKREHAARRAVPGKRASLGGRAVRGFIGLMLAACIGVAAIAWQSPYGDAAKQIIARWVPQLVLISSLPLEKPGLPAQPSPPTVQVAAANIAPTLQAPLAQTAPEDVVPTAAALSPELTQLLQSMAHDLATLGQGIEQLKASQEQMARDNANAAEQLKASQNKWPASLPRLPSRTCGPRYQRLRHGRLPLRRASWGRCSCCRKPQRSRRPKKRSCLRRRGRRCPCASASSTMRGTLALRTRKTAYEVDLLGLYRFSRLPCLFCAVHRGPADECGRGQALYDEAAASVCPRC